MTVGEIKNHVMFQTNNDAEDIEDYIPYIGEYINDGYDRIVAVYDNQHVETGSEDYPPLLEDTEAPNIPEWMHKYLADWATWLIYRNGNPQKQSRGMAYRESFLELLSKIADAGGKSGMVAGRISKFRNIPE